MRDSQRPEDYHTLKNLIIKISQLFNDYEDSISFILDHLRVRKSGVFKKENFSKIRLGISKSLNHRLCLFNEKVGK